MRSSKRKNNGLLFDARAIQLAREALMELDEGEVGRHTGVSVIGKNVVVHHFEADVPGYRGWEWTVVLACADGSRTATVNELALLPGRDALQAPRWIPYEDRVQPGDLRPGDQFPPRTDDDRLEDAQDGKKLTKKGFEDSLLRWRNAYGPTTESAEKSVLKCDSCAFFLPVEQLRTFGICCNEYADDGHVVHMSYGCGAHSATPPADNLAAVEHTPFDDGHL